MRGTAQGISTKLSKSPRRIIGRLGILNFAISRGPTNQWVAEQSREASSFGSVPRFASLNRDAKWGTDAPAAIRSTKIKLVGILISNLRQN